jgi:hypothetical protein
VALLTEPRDDQNIAMFEELRMPSRDLQHATCTNIQIIAAEEHSSFPIDKHDFACRTMENTVR